MKSNFERIINNLQTTFAEDETMQEQLERIDMKSQFRSPEMLHESWNDLARFIKTIPMDALVKLLIVFSDSIIFSEGEKAEI
ncbi:hypothetical protein [Paenibacillus sinopodophylli]|uniref:hypothetical protein n=1 Tax=Paenibacillus sinopodophylli TaxID=1837342 RepID=UPI00110D0B06|nr:hypothetical protein [Paenibacillus sinopodophylli]